MSVSSSSRAIISILFASCAGIAADIYVSPSGSDAADGTQARPFATLERARDAVRAMKSGGQLKEPVTVFLRAGSYSLARSFRLESADSGTPSSPIAWRAYGDEKVVITGARALSGFVPLSDQDARRRIDAKHHDKIVQLDLRANGVTEYGERTPPAPPRQQQEGAQGPGFMRESRAAIAELYFNDKAMTVARWPNDAWERIIEVPQAWESGQIPEDPGYYRLYISGIPMGRHYGFFKYYGDRPKRWNNAQDIWMHGFWALDYRDSYVPIDRIDTAQHYIYPKPPHPRNWGYTTGQRYYYLNILEELDSPGEYYIDKSKGMLFFWPPAPVVQGSASISVLKDTMIVLDGASHVTLQGLTIEGGRAHGVEVRSGSGNRILGCTIRNLGNFAVLLDGTNNGVQSSDIYGTGQGGVSVSGGDRLALTPAGNFADNNHIHDYARINIAGQPAVRLGGVGNKASHNYIHHTPHGAINVGGNDNIVEFNEFHSIALSTGDVGVVYIGGGFTGRGNVIRHNFFHHIKNTPHGYGVVTTYIDNNSSGQTIYGNIYYDVPRAAYIGGGRDNVIENNIMINCQPAFHLDPRGLNWRIWEIDKGYKADLYKSIEAANYKNPPYNKYPGLATLLEKGDPKAPSNNLVARNLVVGGRWKEFVDQWGHIELQSVYADTESEAQFVQYKDNVFTDDPGFVDPASMNFQLKENSPAWKSGFKRIPAESIGLYKDAIRKTLPERKVWLY